MDTWTTLEESYFTPLAGVQLNCGKHSSLAVLVHLTKTLQQQQQQKQATDCECILKSIPIPCKQEHLLNALGA